MDALPTGGVFRFPDPRRRRIIPRRGAARSRGGNDRDRLRCARRPSERFDERLIGLGLAP